MNNVVDHSPTLLDFCSACELGVVASTGIIENACVCVNAFIWSVAVGRFQGRLCGSERGCRASRLQRQNHRFRRCHGNAEAIRLRYTVL